MPRNDQIRTIVVNVHLGHAPSFDIRADDDATATPIDCKFIGHGTGPPDRDFLNQVLHKILAAYGNNQTTILCVQGTRIKRDADCP